LAIAIAATVGAIVLLVGGSIAVLVFDAGDEVAHLAVPETPFRISVTITPGHLYLAEFKRRVALLHDGVEIDSTELAFDTGGYTRLEVFRSGPRAYLPTR